MRGEFLDLAGEIRVIAEAGGTGIIAEGIPQGALRFGWRFPVSGHLQKCGFLQLDGFYEPVGGQLPELTGKDRVEAGVIGGGISVQGPPEIGLEAMKSSRPGMSASGKFQQVLFSYGGHESLVVDPPIGG